MMRKEFQDGMNSIQVDYEVKEKLWEQLSKKQIQATDGFSSKQFFGTNKGSSKFTLWKTWTPVVAALLICMILIPGIVYADEIVNYFQGNLSQSPELAENVNKSVFQDGDKHVTMEVCELLSDGYSTCMTVKYTALDQKGREWLFGKTLLDAPPMYRDDNRNLCEVLDIQPIEDESENIVGASGSFGAQEIEEEQTKTSRMFSLEYNIDNVGSKRCQLSYPLVGESKKKVLSIKNLLPTYTYALNGTSSNVNYTPKYLRLSKIKYTVYGENHGVYQRSGSNYKMNSDEDIHSAILYFKNHSSLDLIGNGPGYFFMGAIDPDDSNCHMDLTVLSGEFYGQDQWITLENSEDLYDEEDLYERIERRLTVDPEDVEKITINGDEYMLSRVD